MKNVVAVPTLYGIVARIPTNRVNSVSAIDRVIAAAALQDIVSALAFDQIVSAATL